MAEVTTQGSGEVERIADRAGLTLSYQGKASSRNEAVAALSTPLARAKPTFERAGVDVRSRRLSVHDEWAGKHRSGCVATQNYQLRVTDLTVLDDLLAAIIATEPAQLHGPHWELAERTAAVAAAQRDAVTDARTRAAGYAEALGTRLGALVRITDDEGGMPGYGAMLGNAAAELSTVEQLGLEPELITVTASCTGTWTLLD